MSHFLNVSHILDLALGKALDSSCSSSDASDDDEDTSVYVPPVNAGGDGENASDGIDNEAGNNNKEEMAVDSESESLPELPTDDDGIGSSDEETNGSQSQGQS